MSTKIFYFTGTGNSLKIAKDLAQQLGDTQLIQIRKEELGAYKETITDKVGIVFPVYFSGMPILVRQFVEALNIDPKAYVFTVSNFGGAVGASIAQLNKILNQKGIALSGQFQIKMPGNYQVMYAPSSEEKQKQIFQDENTKIKEIANSIKNGEVVKQSGVGAKIGAAISGVLYNFFNPYNSDKNYWADEKCNGCGTCSKVCPANNIKIVDKKPQWQHQCEQCVACLQWCPKKSIQYKKATIKRGRYHHPEIKLQEIYKK